MNPIIAEALKPFAPSKCYKCPTIEKGVCLLGQDCNFYDEQRVKAEVERRRAETLKRLMKQLEESK